MPFESGDPQEPDRAPGPSAAPGEPEELVRLERRLSRTSPSPPARPEFRSELRRRFVAGDLTAGAVSAPEPRGRLFRFLVPVAAAAAILAVTFLLPDEPRWTVVDFGGPGGVRVAGGEVQPFEAERLEVELSGGASLDSRENRIALDLARTLRLTVQPGTRVDLAALPRPGTQDPLRLDLAAGEILLRTLDGYPGNPILVHTPETDVRITGTALGILVGEDGTCICVAEGEVRVDDLVSNEADVPIPAETSRFVFESGAPAAEIPFADPPNEEHRHHVQELVRFADA